MVLDLEVFVILEKFGDEFIHILYSEKDANKFIELSEVPEDLYIKRWTVTSMTPAMAAHLSRKKAYYNIDIKVDEYKKQLIAELQESMKALPVHPQLPEAELHRDDIDIGD